MFCVHCGKEISDDATFCMHCGKSQTEVAGSTTNVSAAEAPVVNPVVAPVINSAPVAAPVKKVKKSVGGAAKTGCVFLAIVFFICAEILLMCISLDRIISTETLYALGQDFSDQIGLTTAMETLSTVTEVSLGIALKDIGAGEEGEQLIEDTFTNAIVYYVTGEGDPFDSESWIDYVEDHQEEIEEMAGEEITQEELILFEYALEEVENQAERISPVGNNLITNFTKQMDSMFSVTRIIAAIVIGVIALVLIYVICGKYVHTSLTFNGVTLIVLGVVRVVTSAMYFLANVYLDGLLVKTAAIVISLGKQHMAISSIILLVGIVMTVIGRGMKKRFIKKLEMV